MKLELKIENKKIFSPLKDKWLVLTPEEKVRQEYICRLVNHYGYSLDQMQQEVTVAEGNKRGTGRASADIVIWKNKDEVEKKAPSIVVECKADNIDIVEGDYFQGSHYARYVKAPFFVTTNLKHTKVFKVNLEGYPKDLEDEILDIPTSEDLQSDKKVKNLLTQTKAFTRDEFSNLLLRCHNIIRNNDKLSPEAAFDETSKILFMKIRYERNPDEDNIFSLKQFKKQEAHYEKNIRPINVKRNGPKDDIPYMDYWFELTKDEFKDDDLFDPNEKIRIKQASFEAIVKALEIYNLSTTSDDVKGIAFEKFLGKTFRGELGQFFTPRTVVDYMVEVLDPQEGETICDPCCGSGGFLIKAFEYVRSKIENEIKKAKEEIKLKHYTDDYYKASKKEQEKIDQKVNDLFSLLNTELDIRNPESRLRQLSYDCIFGTDANPRMARTAKMNMIMHGDGHGGVHHHDGLLNVNGIFEERFDLILTNPPFGARVEKSLKVTEQDKYTDKIRIEKYKKRYGDRYTRALKQINDNIGKSVLSLFDTGKMSSLTEVLFIERCLDLLKPGGRMGIVLPEGVLNNTKLQKVRDYVEGNAKIVNITSIPQDVFIASGATVKPSLLFFKKFTKEEANEYTTILKTAKKNAENKREKEITVLQDKIKTRGIDKEEKKELKEKLKQVQQQMEDEIKMEVKTKFDYEIPIVEVEKAGISTTGTKIENELEPIAKEFTKYRIEKRLWNDHYTTVQYDEYDGKFQRIVAFGEPEIFYTIYENIEE
ncbi:N-6 DNA methylase [Otariodibacter oris]|uniref:Type I restriction enzyme M protein n=1 Tax=Otariodibacter oris TaxID=1032623 RepID=A0A420XFN1_9PAST|nr:N-6 DNA methylase [Otariodibacter oris]QGM80269.1 N-6 DNA methylase [Otariodibacter oris]RKR71635.1 type I restriction enzyme M protein [Otariodibacter oris]